MFECLQVHASIVSLLLVEQHSRRDIFPGAFKTTYQLVHSVELGPPLGAVLHIDMPALIMNRFYHVECVF